jgi:hypothetical protein
MRFLVPVVVALTALPCLADSVLHAREPALLALERASLTREEDADLHVTARVLRARYGVRREAGREQFSSSVGLSLGDVYVVRDLRGREHRVRVNVLSPGFVRVELLNQRNTIGLKPPARFRNTSVTVNGQASEARFGVLVLNVDGTYAAGQVRGTWRIEDDALWLEGAVGHWGAARTFDAGQTLTFSFRRGPLEWELRFERVPEEVVAAR